LVIGVVVLISNVTKQVITPDTSRLHKLIISKKHTGQNKIIQAGKLISFH